MDDQKRKEPSTATIENIVKLQLPDNMERMESGPVQFGDDWPGIFFRGDDALVMSMRLSSAIVALVNAGDRIAAGDLREYQKRLNECKAT